MDDPSGEGRKGAGAGILISISSIRITGHLVNAFFFMINYTIQYILLSLSLVIAAVSYELERDFLSLLDSV